jgi:Site-specific DNA methylase
MGVNLTTNFYSPLRYPGGKGKLSFYIQLLFEYNLLTDGHYIEPYAGGASVSLALLFNEYASEIHINDYDYNVYCFWKSAIDRTEELCELIDSTPVNMETWRQQKEIQAKPSSHSQLKVGFSTFFLNRTNRSGILKAGVIGGNGQTGEWKIDARYNKSELINRITKIGRYKERINLYNLDAVELIKQLKSKLPKKSLYYFDPPYYKKGKELYINFYDHSDHVKVSSMIRSLKNKFWLVSYDNNEHIKELYSSFRQQVYDLNYHAHTANKGSEILIFSDNLLVPSLTNPTDKNQIKFFSQNGLALTKGSWQTS